MTYREKLKDPRWQKVRLEVMNRSHFHCEECGADDKTLHVHHKYYKKNTEPWDYHESALACLCEDCHEGDHERRQRVIISMGHLQASDLERVYGYVEALIHLETLRSTIGCGSYEAACGISDALKVDVDLIVECAEGNVVSVEKIGGPF